jgi:glycosyltransferase involved in cell wall biosynthesis
MHIEDKDILISAVLTMHNEELFIGQCIESILNQDHDNFELIVIDDGSTDRSCEIVESYHDKRIRLYRNEQDYIKSLNLGISKASGKYIAHVDADDIMYKSRFSEQIRYMEEHEEVDISGAFMESFGRLNIDYTAATDNNRIISDLLWGVQIFHPVMMFRTSTLIAHDMKEHLYNPQCPLCEDYDLLVSAVLQGLTFGNVPQKLVHYRLSEKQITCAKAEQVRHYMLQVRGKYYNHIMSSLLSRKDYNFKSVIQSLSDRYIKKEIRKTAYLQGISNLYYQYLSIAK